MRPRIGASGIHPAYCGCGRCNPHRRSRISIEGAIALALLIVAGLAGAWHL